MMARTYQLLKPGNGKLLVEEIRNFCAQKNAKSKAKNFKKASTSHDLHRFHKENLLLYGPSLKRIPGNKNDNLNSKYITTPSPNKSSVLPAGTPKVFPLMSSSENDANLNGLAKHIVKFDDKKPPSVTGILQKTMSAESVAVLERWRNEMIKQLGVEGFAKYTKETFETGAAFHHVIHEFLNGIPATQLDIQKNIEGYWNSIETLLPKISDVVTLENKIIHPYLNYVGVVDCIAKFNGKPVLIEWKTSQKPKPTLRQTYDNPIQIAAYMGSWNFCSTSTQVENGLIVISYPTGEPCHVHEMNPDFCRQAWGSWITRLSDYHQFLASKSMHVSAYV